jgi:hypothetical protein
MNYLERYRNGEYEQVWDELRALGPAVRDEPHYSQAREVAAETMRRVRRHTPSLAGQYLWHLPGRQHRILYRRAAGPPHRREPCRDV